MKTEDKVLYSIMGMVFSFGGGLGFGLVTTGTRVSINLIEEATQSCSVNGGIYDIDANSFRVKCENGAIFFLTEKS